MSLTTLPTDVLTRVFVPLNATTTHALILVNKQFHSIIDRDVMWEWKLEYRLGVGGKCYNAKEEYVRLRNAGYPHVEGSVLLPWFLTMKSYVVKLDYSIRWTVYIVEGGYCFVCNGEKDRLLRRGIDDCMLDRSTDRGAATVAMLTRDGQLLLTILDRSLSSYGDYTYTIPNVASLICHDHDRCTYIHTDRTAYRSSLTGGLATWKIDLPPSSTNNYTLHSNGDLIYENRVVARDVISATRTTETRRLCYITYTE
jgi:hypothetical protein